MNDSRIARIGIVLAVIAVLSASGCGPTPTSVPVSTNAPAATSAPMVRTVAVAGAPQVQVVTMVPAATRAPGGTLVPPAPPDSGPGQAGVPGLPSVPYAQDRMIVKSGEMDLLVVDTDVAIAGVTQAAVDYGGYLLSGRSWYQDNYKFAQITLGVPSDQYEAALGRLRRLGIVVMRETSAGQDVTDEYVDLESRLRNLEAQAERLRVFMGQAQNVQEAITVSQSLTGVEDQIEQIKGRMNYLGGRAAVSTITVNIQPQRPTPEPTMTPTNTPTPTPTLTPTATPTPTRWSPGQTAERAFGTTGLIFQSLLDLLIWLVAVVVLPVAPALLIAWFVWRLLNRRRARLVP